MKNILKILLLIVLFILLISCATITLPQITQTKITIPSPTLTFTSISTIAPTQTPNPTPIPAPHFKLEDFKCGCDNKWCNGYLKSVPTGVVPKLYDLLEKIYEEVQNKYGNSGPINITIIHGYRCPKYNATVPNSVTGSYHTNGIAADISCDVCTVYQLGVICDKLNPNGGVGLGSDEGYVHIDVRGKKSRWWYKYKSWKLWEKACNK
jgi:hypothetical protein